MANGTDPSPSKRRDAIPRASRRLLGIPYPHTVRTCQKPREQQESVDVKVYAVPFIATLPGRVKRSMARIPHDGG